MPGMKMNTVQFALDTLTEMRKFFVFLLFVQRENQFLTFDLTFEFCYFD